MTRYIHLNYHEYNFIYFIISNWKMNHGVKIDILLIHFKLYLK